MRKCNAKFCVYLHKINDHVFYVGSGTIDRAYIKGRRGKDRNIKWFEIVEQNNYKYDIVIVAEDNDRQKCFDMEFELTIKYKSLGMCEANINIGKHVSDETRQKLSIVLKGKFAKENNPFFGKHHTKETIERIRQSNLGRKDSDEANAKKKLIGVNNPSARKVVAIYENEVKYYNLIKDLVFDIGCINASAYARGILGTPPHYWANGKCYILYQEDYEHDNFLISIAKNNNEVVTE